MARTPGEITNTILSTISADGHGVRGTTEAEEFSKLHPDMASLVISEKVLPAIRFLESNKIN